MNKYISYESLNEIIEALRPGKIGNDKTYVGKNYSKEMLINDLIKINEAQKWSDKINTGECAGS